MGLHSIRLLTFSKMCDMIFHIMMHKSNEIKLVYRVNGNSTYTSCHVVWPGRFLFSKLYSFSSLGFPKNAMISLGV